MSGMFHLLSDDSPPCSPRAAGGSTEVDYVAIFQAWRDADPILAGMHDGTISWADACDLDDREWAARGGRPVALEAGYEMAKPARYRAPRPPLPAAPRAAAGGGWASVRAAPARPCGGGGGGACSHSTPETRSRSSSVASESEECRFFNSPAGCRNGDDCPYVHVKRSIGEIRCRFLDTERGCRPSRGVRCPYKH